MSITINGTEYGTIQAAVTAANAGETILLSAGTYVLSSQLDITKSITIQGAGLGETIIQQSGAPSGTEARTVQISANDVTIQNLSFTGWTTPTTEATAGRGYLVWNTGNGTTFDHVGFDADNIRVALYIGTSNDITVTHSEFTGDLFRYAIRGAGEHMQITDNVFETAHYQGGPIYMEYGAPTSGVISGNVFEHSVGVSTHLPADGDFQSDGTLATTIINWQPNKITADGLTIENNTFHFVNADARQEVTGTAPQPMAIYNDPLVDAGGPIIVRGNVFEGYDYDPAPFVLPTEVTDSHAGNALQFDGAESYASFTLANDIGQQGSLSVWVDLDAGATGKRNQILEGPGDGGLEFQYRNNTGGQFYGSPNGTDGNNFAIQSGGAAAGATSWTNVQYVWNFVSPGNGFMKVYVNGTEVSYLSAAFDSAMANWQHALSTAGGTFYLGRDPGDATRMFDGRMDELAIFNTALSKSDLDIVRTSSASVDTTSFTSLQAFWTFDSVTGDVIASERGTNVQLELHSLKDVDLAVVTVNGGTAGAIITGNSFDGDGIAVRADGNVSAEGNWWNTTDPAEVADRIDGDADYSAFLQNGIDSSDAPGFQPEGIVVGTSGNDTLSGSPDADTIFGLAGNDTITGGEGNDSIDGGAGIDTAVYSGDVAITSTATGFSVDGGASDGVDTLDDVEIVVDGAGARTLLVGNGGYATIQAAINAASAGDTILVAAGEHLGNVLIDKAVTLLGANAGIDGNGARGAESVILGKVDVTSSVAVTIDGFEVRNTEATTRGGPSNPALWFATGGTGEGHLVTHTVFNSVVAGGTSGVDDRAIAMGPIATGAVRIEDNLFTGTSEGKYGTASWGRGIWSDGGGVELSITGNEFEYTRSAINYDGPDGGSSPHLTIEGNTFTAAGTAMSFAAGGTVTGIVDNTFNDVDTDFNFQNVNNGVTLDLGATENLATDGQAMVVLGGSAADVITGSAGADVVQGNGGADQINGAGGADTLNGGAGDDTIEGGGGNDSIDGGSGVDTVVYDGTVTLATNGSGGWTVTAGDEGTDTLSNVEVVNDRAGGKILLVGKGGYLSIADAITAAESGDTIQVAAGEWTLPSGDSGKNLTFLGANAGIDANGDRGPETIILGTGNFRFGGDNDTFDGFTFSGSQTFDSYVEGAEITLANNIMTNTGSTVLYVLNKPDSVTIVGNHITGVNGSDDAFFVAGDWNGLTGTQVNISGNVIEGSTAAGFNLSSVHGTIADNVIDGVTYYGFLLANDTDVDVTGNTFENIVNPDPLVLTWGAGVRTYTPGEHFGLNLDGNSFIDNAVGLGIRTGSDIDPASIIVVNNTFTGNGNAVVNQGVATTDVALDGSNTVDGVLLSDATASDLLAISDNVIDGVDLSGVGSVILKAGNVYLTASSFVEPLTDAPSLQRALDVAQAGDTVHVGAGSYSGAATTAVDNLTITAPADATGLAVTLGDGVFSLTLGGESEIDVTGNALANVLTGNSGANVLDGGAGADTMAGGLGNDTYVVDDVDDVVTEAESQGTDVVQSSASSYTLSANVENMILMGTGDINGTGNDLANVLTGNLGANVLDGGAGADTMAGGLGNDTYVVDDEDDVVTEAAGAGTDTVQSSIDYTLGGNLENLTLTGVAIVGTGNGLANTIVGNDQDNELNGDAGDDTLEGGEGQDTLSGGSGNDILRGDAGDDLLLGSTGDDILVGGAGIDSMRGGTGNDTYVVDNADDSILESANQGIDTVEASIGWTLGSNLENLTLTGAGNINGTGNGVANILIGNTGANVLDGGAGADQMAGGLGDDTYVVDNTIDEITELAGEGNDQVQSSVSYTLSANVEGLTLTGGANLNGTGNGGVNALTGNAGNNVLDGKAGADTMAGGLGDDTYVVDNALDTVTELTNQGTDTVQSSVDWTLGSNLERLTLTGSANLNGTGNSLANVLTGNAGNNVLNGGTAADTMAGGLGDDTYVVDNIGDLVTELAGEGNDLVQSSVSYTLSANVEGLTLTGTRNIDGTGNDGDNVLTGNTGNNVLDGKEGADTMAGRGGDDTYVVDNVLDVVKELANMGTDTVLSSLNWTLATNLENLTLTGTGNLNGTGNSVANVLTGNAGNNVLDGKAAADTMAGGLGDDTYMVDNTGDVITELAGEGNDQVQSSVSYTLSANVESLTLTGTGNIDGTGNGGVNTLTGNTGNNVLDGKGGADTMAGGLGDDTYVVDDVLDTVTERANQGADTVQSSVDWTLGSNLERLTLTGSANLNGTGNSLANVLTGNAGNNVLNGGTAADTMAGGLGDDTYVVDNINDAVTELAGEGNDLVQSSVSYTLSANVEGLTLTGTGNIDGTGNDGDNALTGNAGNNVLDGKEGADTMAGRGGDDTYVVDNVLDVVKEQANQGTDTVLSSVNWTLGANLENLTLTGTGNLNGTGNSVANVLTGNVGNNVLDGGAGADTMAGGLGNDTYIVDNTGDVVTELSGQGDDLVLSSASFTLSANIESLTLTGTGNIDGTGNDGVNALTGNAGNNVLDGRAGNDTIEGGDGDDTIDGGSGVDTAVYSEETVVSHVGGVWSVDGGETDGVDTLSNVEIVVDGSGRKTLLVGDGGFATIQAAVDAASAGDTILVADGEYTGNVVIDKALTLLGANAGIAGSGLRGAESVILGKIDVTSSAAVTIDGFEVRNTGATTGGGPSNPAVWFATGGSASGHLVTHTVFNSIVEGGANGVDDRAIGMGPIATGAVRIEDNLFTGTSVGKYGTASWGRGIWSDGGGVELSITGNEFENTRSAINYDGPDGASSPHLTIEGNTFGVAGTAMSFAAGGDVTGITGNTFNDVDTDFNFQNITNSVTLDLGETENLATPGQPMVVLGGSAGDVITGSSGSDVLQGNGGADTLKGGAGDDNLSGGAGDDAIDGGTGADAMAGGSGDDVYVVDDEGDVVTEALDAGTDTVMSSIDYTLGDNLEKLTLTGDALIGVGNALGNVLTGNSGANELDGRGGNDTMAGGLGNDIYVVDSTDDVVLEDDDAGTDLVRSSATFTLGANVENLTLTGGGNVNGTGNNLVNLLTGNSGNNLLDGAEGADTMAGGLGDDTYVVDGATDLVVEGENAGTDLVRASASYWLSANVENLTLTGDDNIDGTGNELANVLTGNSGNNVLDGGEGADTMSGGLGDDIYVVDNAGDQVVENASGGSDTVLSLIDYALGADLENLQLFGSATDGTGNDLGNTITGGGVDNTLDGGAGDDVLSGNEGNDTLIGGLGNDGLYGGSGDDLLLGGSNDDHLDGGTGADTMMGGSGNDTYVVDNIGDVVSEGANQGIDAVSASLNYTLNANVENLTLTGGSDINGTGNALGNTIAGNSGNNLINGGLGNDILTGGSGNDSFVFNTTLNGTTNVDHITDFTVGSDMFNLAQSVFTQIGLGTLSETAFHVGASATDAAQRIIYDQNTGHVMYDADGSGVGAAVQFAAVTADTVLRHDDFLIV